MSIQITITASDAVDLGAKIANLFHTITTAHPGPPDSGQMMTATEAAQAEVVDSPKKPRGRPAKAQTIEGTVNTTEAKPEEPSNPDAGAAEQGVSEDDLRTKIIAWVNDTAAAGGGGDDKRRVALETLRKEHGFQKIQDIPADKRDAVVAWLAANPPKAVDDDIV